VEDFLSRRWGKGWRANTLDVKEKERGKEEESSRCNKVRKDEAVC
jgi:hypothetical protein